MYAVRAGQTLSPTIMSKYPSNLEGFWSNDDMFQERIQRSLIVDTAHSYSFVGSKDKYRIHEWVKQREGTMKLCLVVQA